MVDCDFCGKTIEPGTGKLYVRKEGSVFRYCSSKCEKTMTKRGFKARITPWTKQFAQIKKMKK